MRAAATVTRKLRALILMLAGLLAACQSTESLYRKAQSGDAAACYNYARHLIDNPTAHPQATAEACTWLEKASDAGSRNAPALLGALYATGHGIPTDYSKAIHYLSIASDRDHPRAQLLLALLYAKGKGTTMAPHKAAEHIRYAAMQGSPAAALLMFYCFYDGFGVRKTPELAYGWLQNAADYGSTDAQKLLVTLISDPNSEKFNQEINFLRKKLDFFPQNR